MTRTFRGTLLCGLLAVLVRAAAPAVAFATTYDFSPRQAILFADGTKFIAQDGWNSAALYRTADGAAIHRFPAPNRVNCIAISPDEKRLLVACSDGSLLLWNVESGERVWQKEPVATGLKYIWGATFSGNGERIMACASQGDAIVLDARTGERIGTVGLPPKLTRITSVALNADGTGGFLIDVGGRLHSFDVATARVEVTEFTGAGPVRYSTDGKYVAFRSSNSGSAERLSVVRVGEKLTKRDLGEFSHIAHIRPARDGSFLVTARSSRRSDEKGYWEELVGTRIRPDNERVEELWRPGSEGVNERTDYLPESMIGVSTDFRLITTVTDLRTGKVTLTIDNSANARLEMTSTSFVGHNRPIALLEEWTSVLAVLLSILVAVFLVRRVRRELRERA